MDIGFNADALSTNLQLGVVADLDALAELLGLPATNAAARTGCMQMTACNARQTACDV
jgi:hypothetical protein